MTYLIIGADTRQRETKISELKRQHIPIPDSVSFDYEILYAHRLDPDTLRKALLALPVFSSIRFVLLRECHKLTEHNRGVIREFLAGQPKHLLLVMESEGLKASDRFVKEIKPYAEIVQARVPREVNVFDVTRCMSRGQPAQALKILDGLLSGGAYPLQLLGGLLWFWGECRETLDPEKFQAGLRALQAADLDIKRSRLKPEYSLEVLVTKLCGLMGYEEAESLLSRRA